MCLLLAACSGDGERESAQSTSAPQATTAEPKLDPRCIAVPPAVSSAIATGIYGTRQTLTSAYAVKSSAFGSVFFVSGRVSRAPSSPIGTWATNNLSFGGLIFSVDRVAKKLSRWADGAKFRPKLTMKLDGARVSRTCAKQASG